MTESEETAIPSGADKIAEKAARWRSQIGDGAAPHPLPGADYLMPHQYPFSRVMQALLGDDVTKKAEAGFDLSLVMSSIANGVQFYVEAKDAISNLGESIGEGAVAETNFLSFMADLMNFCADASMAFQDAVYYKGRLDEKAEKGQKNADTPPESILISFGLKGLILKF